MRRCLLFAVSLLAATLRAEKVEEYFHFDPADETIPVTLLEKPLYYDAGIAPTTNGTWVAWLEFIPGQGDQLWVGLRQGEKWVVKKQISAKAGDYANPTVTVDAKGKLWLTYEAAFGDNWDVVVASLDYDSAKPSELTLTNSQVCSSGASADINHRVAVKRDGGLWIVWQAGGPASQADPESLRYGLSFFDTANPASPSLKGFNYTLDDWRPSLTVTPDGELHVVFDGAVAGANGYDVLGFSMGKPIISIASSSSFEAHAQMASDKTGKLYVIWEQDGENWGQHYLARTHGEKQSTRMVDNEGPVHRFRRMHFAELDEKKATLKEYELPQPSFDLAAKRTNTPPGLKNFGAFYENGQLVVDGQNRPWIVYRHFYVPWIGLVPETHKQDNMRIYARCLLSDGWSKLYTFSEGQGDGMQRVQVAPTADGIAVAYTIGRTDRRKGESQSDRKRGVALAEIHLNNAKAMTPAPSKMEQRDLVGITPVGPATRVSTRIQPRSAVGVAGKKYELFFGDMHRHTDISLCYSPVDGTIEDAYRYAIDAARLDFLGITDHTHDLAMGDGLSLIWHRSRKEVNRHALAERFIPLFSYERSRGDTDHNVFSLRGDILKPHTYPLSQFWEEIDTNTFTVAHQPFNPVTWNYKDDVHRPLLEIYQGYRNDAKEEDAKQALLRGHHVGFIAASDHLSTGGSYACVWAEKPERESLFRAMQARRTYAATAKIRLRVMCGEHWMGERFEVKEMPPIRVTVGGTDTISALDFFVDGVLKSSATDILQSKKHDVTWEVPPDKSLNGPHIFYIRVTQTDGNRAWSSPLWVDVQK